MNNYKSKMKPFNDTYVMYQLLEFIDESSIIYLCKASKKLNEICKSYIEIEDDKRFEIIDHYYLLEKYCKNNDVIKVRKMININIDINWNDGLYSACEGGHLNIINLIINRCDYTGYNWGLFGACRNGHINIVKLIIEKGAHWWDYGLYGACKGGHIDIVKFMIEKGAKYWNWGLYGACEGDHIDIVKLMIEKGATRCGYCKKSLEVHLIKSE